VKNCVVQKTDEAKTWESYSSNCVKYECLNNTGNTRHDTCEPENDKPKCFNYYCFNNKCSNSSRYYGNQTGCVKSIRCTDDGWEETAKNCTADVLANPGTSKFINEKTASCYNFSCGNGGKCSYTAFDTCGKVCESIESECKAKLSSLKCKKYVGCEEALSSNGIWEAECKYDDKDGYEELKQQENQCYEVVCENNEWVLKKTLSATQWEARTTRACEIYECDNETGNIKRDICVEGNSQPQCFRSVCQYDGTCSNLSLYEGNETGCIGTITCTEEGWNETERNCTEEMLSYVSETEIQSADRIGCYDIRCWYGNCIVFSQISDCNPISEAHRIDNMISTIMMALVMTIFLVFNQ